MLASTQMLDLQNTKTLRHTHRSYKKNLKIICISGPSTVQQ